MKFLLKKFNRHITDGEFIDDVIAVAKKLGKNTVTKTDYLQYGQYGSSTILRRFRSWFTVLQLAGLEPVREYNIDKALLFQNLEKVWIELGRQPVVKEMKYPQSRYSVHPYMRRFGTWVNALEKFIAYQNQKLRGSGQIQKRIRLYKKERNGKNKKIKGNSREVPLQLRFSVFVRDGFRCTACGKSPLSQQGVKLHCDHIMPWSKGGKTVVGNLQTLCSACNLSKGGKFEVKTGL